MKKSVFALIATFVLGACSTGVPPKENVISSSSTSSALKNINAPFAYRQTDKKIICHKANPERENEMKEIVKSVDGHLITNVYLGSECDFPGGPVALTAILWATHDNNFSVDLGLYAIQDKQVWNMGGEFETHAGDFGVCDLLMADDGYIFSYCNSSEGGGTYIEYNAFRIADRQSQNLVKVSGHGAWDDNSKPQYAITKNKFLCDSAGFPCDELLALIPPPK